MAGGGQGGGQGQMPSISPQSISDFQNLLQYYQQNKGGMGGGMGAPTSMPRTGMVPPQQGGQPPASGTPSFGDKYSQGMTQALNNMIAAGTITGIADSSGRISRPGDPGFGSQMQPASQPQTFNTKPFNQGPAPVQNTGGPDMTGMTPGSDMGFDRSGSDAGVGGSPVNQVQSPYQNQGGFLGGGKPPMMSDFRPQQGLQIQGNPTTMPLRSRKMQMR